jgi:hypothetical protein
VDDGAGSNAAAGARDRALAVGGLVIATLLGFVTSLWEAFLSPLAVHWTSGGHAHFARVPVALVAAVVGNAALSWMAYTVTGRMLAIGAPFVAWTVPVFLAAEKTSEGDLVLTANNWVGLTTMLVGALTYAVVVYWLTIRSLRQPRDRVVTEPVWRDPADAR